MPLSVRDPILHHDFEPHTSARETPQQPFRWPSRKFPFGRGPMQVESHGNESPCPTPLVEPFRDRHTHKAGCRPQHLCCCRQMESLLDQSDEPQTCRAVKSLLIEVEVRAQNTRRAAMGAIGRAIQPLRGPLQTIIEPVLLSQPRRESRTAGRSVVQECGNQVLASRAPRTSNSDADLVRFCAQSFCQRLTQPSGERQSVGPTCTSGQLQLEYIGSGLVNKSDVALYTLRASVPASAMAALQPRALPAGKWPMPLD